MNAIERYANRISRTQTLLLEKAKRDGRIEITSASGRGSDGGKIRLTNSRRRDAAIELQRAGKLRFVGHDHNRVTRNGFTTDYLTSVWELI